MIALLLAGLAALSPAERAAKFKLQPGAEGKLCLDCHADFQKKLKKPFVHTPVKGKDCTGCHNPHASEHGKLLEVDQKQICATCHQGVVPKQAASVHQPVAEGNCVACHDPHASDTKFELVKPGVGACAKCHGAITDAFTQSRHKHRIAGEASSCTVCHDPHASAKGEKLLKGSVPGLCLSCHTANKGLLALHFNYPVQKANCTLCHDPHGSDKPSMLYNTVHRPLLAGKCTDCHVAPTSAKPFETKTRPQALCKSCHAGQLAQMLEKPQVHWAVVDDKGCLNCHTPHASRQRSLVAAKSSVVCGTCHADTIARQDRSPTKHKPVQEGDCVSCHSPHSSDSPLLMKRPDTVQLCGTCHDWQKHSSHPIGAKLLDPRNKNLSLNCLSCHRAHGTEYPHMNPFPTTTDLCTKCHEKFKR